MHWYMMERHETFWCAGESVLGNVGGGAAVMMSGLDSERLVLAAGPLG